MRSYHRGCTYFANSLMKIAEDNGTLKIANDNNERDCDSIAAQYATTNNALAIITCDSDYLFYDGDWQRWHLDTIDMTQFTAQRFNRGALMKKFQLTCEQMKVFATIAGNDYTKELKWRGHRHQDFGLIAHFLSIANYNSR